MDMGGQLYVFYNPHFKKTERKKVNMVASLKDLRNGWVVVPIIPLFNLPVWPLQNPDKSWRMAMDYHKSNQILSPIAAAVPSMLSLLEQISRDSGT